MYIELADSSSLVLKQPFFSRVFGRLWQFCVGGAISSGSLLALTVLELPKPSGVFEILIVSVFAVGGAWAAWIGFCGLFFPRTLFVNRGTKVVIIKNDLALLSFLRTVRVGFDEIKSIGLQYHVESSGPGGWTKTDKWRLSLNRVDGNQVFMWDYENDERHKAEDVSRTLGEYISKPVTETAKPRK